MSLLNILSGTDFSCKHAQLCPEVSVIYMETAWSFWVLPSWNSNWNSVLNLYFCLSKTFLKFLFHFSAVSRGKRNEPQTLELWVSLLILSGDSPPASWDFLACLHGLIIFREGFGELCRSLQFSALPSAVLQDPPLPPHLCCVPGQDPCFLYFVQYCDYFNTHAPTPVYHCLEAKIQIS